MIDAIVAAARTTETPMTAVPARALLPNDSERMPSGPDHDGPGREQAAEDEEDGLALLRLFGGEHQERVHHGPRTLHGRSAGRHLGAARAVARVEAALGRLDLAVVVAAELRVAVRALGGPVERHEAKLRDRLARATA